MTKIVGEREIPLSDLVLGRGQVRQDDTGKEIHELAQSIAKQGLLHPILVAPLEGGKFEIILGQRRFLAHQQLGRETISARLLDERVDETQAKVISLTENLMRRDLTRSDKIDACTYLYKKYGGNAKTVARKTGLKYSDVLQYVKYDRLCDALKALVDKGEVVLKTALRAQDAADLADEGEEEAVKLAREMSGMSGAQQKKIKETLGGRGDKSVDDAIEEAKGGGKITQILVTLGTDAHGSLKRFASDEGSNMDDAAGSLIEEGLLGKGYLETDS